MSLALPLQFDSSQVTAIIRKLCERFQIAFSENRVNPTLSDLAVESSDDLNEVLNAVGKKFGLRFRPLVGNFRDLVDVVSDSGPAIIQTKTNQSLVILRPGKRGTFEIHFEGKDSTVSSRWLKKHIDANEEGFYTWLIAQPVLAAENASRFQYQTGRDQAPIKPLRRLMEFLRPESQDVRTILIFSVVIGLLSLTTPLAVEAVVNTIAFGKYLQPLIVLSAIVLIFLGFRAALNVLMTIVTEFLQRKLFVRTVEDLSYRLTRVPLSVWKKYHGPELVNRFFDIVSVQKITSKLLLESLMLFLQTIIGLTVLAFYHPFLLGYDIGLLVMMSVVLFFIGKGAIATAKEESQLKYETAAWLQEIVRHPSTFKFNGGLCYAIHRADELAASYINHRQSHFNILIRQISFSMIMQVLAATILLALGGFLVIDGQMTLGQLVAAELIVTVILGSFAKLGKDLESFYDLMASVDKLGKLFDLPVETANKLQLAKVPGAYSYSLVDLGQDQESLTIDIEAGSTVAISGVAELDRTRLIERLTGQTENKSGYVMLNDFRVDSLSAESIQSKISLIREIEIFDGTIDENIRMGRQHIGSRQVNDVVEILGLQKVIADLENGFATPLSVSGYPLSTRHAIRLMLARSFIAEPGALFVDGLLDRLSDSDIEDILPRLDKLKSKTTILISSGRTRIVEWANDNLLVVGDRVQKLR